MYDIVVGQAAEWIYGEGLPSVQQRLQVSEDPARDISRQCLTDGAAKRTAATHTGRKPAVPANDSVREKWITDY